MAESIKPRLAKGTRDFTPEDMLLRNHIIETIRGTFTLYGFEQIETPAVENLETLTGKYGDEGDKLIFKILNSGDFLKEVDNSLLQAKKSDKLISSLCEKALRYDLTVPFARYIVQHRNDINFPFRRYQIQPVWRADNPQKGRYREFYQCDADVIGSDSLLIEAEFVNLIDDVFKRLEIKSEVKLNSRKLLLGFCEEYNIRDKFVEFTTILDKLDKKPWQEVEEEFRLKNFNEAVISGTKKLMEYSGKKLNTASIDSLQELFKTSDTAIQGINELKLINNALSVNPVSFVDVMLDITLARGLNYYTGTIIEVIAKEHNMGSICGGGRYDDLTGIFGLPGVSGIGISFGIDRLFDILTGVGRKVVNDQIKVMLVNFGDELLEYYLKMLRNLRESGVTAELYPDSDKMKKQFKYADQKKLQFVLIAGSEEKLKNIFRLKNLTTGEQQDIPYDLVVSALKNKS